MASHRDSAAGWCAFKSRRPRTLATKRSTAVFLAMVSVGTASASVQQSSAPPHSPTPQAQLTPSESELYKHAQSLIDWARVRFARALPARPPLGAFFGTRFATEFCNAGATVLRASRSRRKTYPLRDVSMFAFTSRRQRFDNPAVRDNSVTLTAVV